MWIRKVPLANLTLHGLAEAVASAVGPDGCFCFLKQETISQRTRGLGKTAIINNLKVLIAGGLVRKFEGQEQFAILDAHGVRYSRDKPPMVLELLIPASAYEAADLARVNVMRAAMGREPITPESRPDITETIGTRTTRKDAGQAAPQRRRKNVRAAEELAASEPLPPVPEEEPDLPHYDDPGLDEWTDDPPAEDSDESQVFQKHQTYIQMTLARDLIPVRPWVLNHRVEHRSSAARTDRMERDQLSGTTTRT